MSSPTPLTAANLAAVGDALHETSSAQDVINPTKLSGASEMDSESNDGSASDSGSANSSSTYQYSHEPYETFQVKARALAERIGQSDKVQLQRARGGAFNRVVIAHFQPEFTSASGIFRIPRASQPDADDEEGEDQSGIENVHQDIIDQVAVGQFLSEHGVPAPKLWGFDATTANELKQPYTLLEFSDGTKLFDIYKDLSLTAKKSIINEMVAFLVQAEQITFNEAGILGADQDPSMPSKWSCFSEDALKNCAIKVTAQVLETEVPLLCPAPCRTLAEYLKQLLMASLDHEKEIDGSFVEVYARLLQIAEEMEASGLLCTSDEQEMHNVLHHWDLEAHNLLVKTSSPQEDSAAGGLDQAWKLDKIIDWDNVQAVPSIIARRPPTWLWDTTVMPDDSKTPTRLWEVTIDDEPSDFFVTGKGAQRMTPDDHAIKQHFEHTFVIEMQKVNPAYTKSIYQDEAYGRGKWIRRLARFALYGVPSLHEYDRFQELDKQWIAARTGLQPAEVPEMVKSERQPGMLSRLLSYARKLASKVGRKISRLFRKIIPRLSRKLLRLLKFET